MLRIFENSVASVHNPPLLVVLISGEQSSWCQQFAEEGYDVLQMATPLSSHNLGDDIAAAAVYIQRTVSRRATWGIITYGLLKGDENIVASLTAVAGFDHLKACIHFTPVVEDSSLLIRASDGTCIPTIVHLASSQEILHAMLSLQSPAALDMAPPTDRYPVTIYTYPLVPVSPPFPFATKAPVSVRAGEPFSVDPHVRSASSLSYTRTLELLRRQLGPHFDLEKLWEMHTYYEFAERDALKTMSTMVKVPYVNHVATLTGGVGYDDLARFYKINMPQVSPPDTELITVSRTIGADRVIDEMIFKCTHTTEIDYFLPGVEPTGKPIEIAMVGVVAFRGDKLTFDYWDQASVLVQLGLLDPTGLPVAGVEVARKVLDPFGIPSNGLLARWKESEGLSI
ncbi:NTF2-like protein [Auriscalpium vulgare]|uniref:NTF2-like protein n=1 Tax=Auriscalpium vulgare TaxID=40419 RepID=A0ACB8SBQ6_9AGAM|nr:NTF2-like protein [Auriscalpium vulgare]